MAYVFDVCREVLFQAGIYWFLAFGLWINFRVLRFVDLSIENVMLAGGMLACSFASSSFAAAYTAIIFILVSAVLAAFAFACWKPLKIHSVIVSLGLSYFVYSILLWKFGAMTAGTHLSKLRPDWHGFFVVYGTLSAVTVMLSFIQHTPFGRRFVAAASNPELARSLGINVSVNQYAGLLVAFGLMLISGLLHARYYTYVNIGDAVGFLLLGIFAVVFMANVLSPRVSFARNAPACIVSVSVFLGVIAIAIEAGVPPSLTKAVMGIVLVGLLAAIRRRKSIQLISATS